MNQPLSAPHKTRTSCYHCGDDCITLVPFDDKSFCCNGCKTVYQILSDQDLDEYYHVERNPGIRPSRGNATNRYKFLDIPEIQNQFLDFKEGNLARTTVLLPQIHCASCVWLLENLSRMDPSILNTEVNFIARTAAISFNSDKISLKEIALLLNRIGYAPTFDKKKKAKRVSRQFLMRMAVAGFCFGNIMLLSFPEYLIQSDQELEEFRPLFSWLIFGLSVPVLLYSSFDYLTSAWKAVTSKTLNLDVPIALGIAVLYGKSAFDILSSNGPGYLDSFAGFVFLLLVGRWFQNMSYDALAFDRDYKSYFPLAVSKITDDEEHIVPIAEVHEGDILLVRNQEVIPADSILMANEASIDYSFVTGESTPVHKEKGDLIFAGGKQVGPLIKLKAAKAVDQSYLTSLWNQKAFSKSDSSRYSVLTDTFSKYFLFAVLIVAAAAGISWYFIDPSRIASIVTAVLIVACPCALALAMPFTYGNIRRYFGKAGLYLRNTNVVESLTSVTDLVFDKTGTLTETGSSHIEFVGSPLTPEDQQLIRSLVVHSHHPLSFSISNHLDTEVIHEVSGFQEFEGKGLEGQIQERLIRLGSAAFTGNESSNETRVYIQIDNTPRGFFRFTNHDRPGITTLLNDLKDQDLHLLSGDAKPGHSRYDKSIAPERTHFEQSPEQKLKYIKTLQNHGGKVMMIGDGLNDAGALKQSDLGIAVAENIHDFSPASDAIIDANKLVRLSEFLHVANQSRKILKVCFAFSILYNFIGLGFAITGSLTPLVAAILMPLSSISIILLSTLLTFGVTRQLFS